MQCPHQRAPDRTRQPAADRHRGRAIGVRLRDGQRPRDDPDRHRLALPVFRLGRVPVRRRRAAAGAIDRRDVHRRGNVEAAHRHLGDGGAASPGGTDGEDPGDARLPVEGAADAGHRCRLVQGGIRGDRRTSLRRPRQCDRRMDDGLQGAVDQRRAEIRREIRQVFRRAVPAEAGAEPDSRSGSAARAVRRCAAPRNTATRGIRSAPIRNSRWILSAASRPAWRSCAA